MVSFVLRRVALVKTDVSEEHIACCEEMRRLLFAASVVPSSQILVTLMKEALRSSDTSVLTRATWHDIPEDTIHHSHRRENLKSYITRPRFVSAPEATCCMRAGSGTSYCVHFTGGSLAAHWRLTGGSLAAHWRLAPDS
jgi:hypothetical protein